MRTQKFTWERQRNAPPTEIRGVDLDVICTRADVSRSGPGKYETDVHRNSTT